MSEKPDLDPENYSVGDLIKILNIGSSISKEELVDYGKTYISKYITEDQEKAAFFAKAIKRLIDNFDDIEDYFPSSETLKDGFAENTLKNQYYNDGSLLQKVANTIPNRQNNVSLINEDHSTQAQGRLLSQNVHAPSSVQGNINPILQNKYISWINVDSHYREIRRNLDSTSCDFNTTASLNIKILDSSTDYTFNLSEPITNVTALSLKSMEIPMNAYYPVSEKYGTNSFVVKEIIPASTPPVLMPGTVPCCIKIPSGFYPSFKNGNDIWDTTAGGGHTLRTVINEQLTAQCPDISLTINPNTQKTSFINNSPTKTYQIVFYSETGLDCTENSCLSNNNGARIDSNLGWLLGFRQPQYTLNKSPGSDDSPNTIVSESIVNPWGTRYLLLEIDDLNRNRNSGNLISMSSNKDKLKLPEYYNKTKQLYPACATDVNGNPNIDGIQLRPNAINPEDPLYQTRPCRTGTPATTPLVDGFDNLTKAQKYTITEIVNRRKTQDQIRYQSPVNTNILFRTSVNRVSVNALTGSETAMVVSNDEGFDMARQYFGPVTIKTLKVKLLNDKGYPIDLNADWSFSLLTERLYQY